MSKYHITPEANAEIMRHLHDWARYVDCDALRDDWRAGAGFLFDFGLIDLGQLGELLEMFPEPATPRPDAGRADLLDLLAGYLRMIRRSGRSFPAVTLDDLEKSLLHVLHENGRTPENGWRAK